MALTTATAAASIIRKTSDTPINAFTTSRTWLCTAAAPSSSPRDSTRYSFSMVSLLIPIARAAG